MYENMMPVRAKRPWGVWTVFATLGMICAPIPFFFLGGSRGLMVGLLFGLVLMTGDGTFRRFMHCLNTFLVKDFWTWFLYAWFLVGVLVGILRAGNDWNIWLTMAINTTALIFGQFLSQSEDYRRFAIWAGLTAIAFQNAISEHWVLAQGLNFRDALGEATRAGVGSAYGETMHWSAVAVFLPIAVAEVLKTRSLAFKVLGCGMVFLCCYCILFSGFAAPTILLLLGTVMCGVMLVTHGRGTVGSLGIALLLAAVLVFVAWQGFQVVRVGNDSRLRDASARINSLLEDPAKGEYGGQGDADTTRLAMARWGWKMFMERPFFGWGGDIRNNHVTAGHNSLFDFLADYGLFGGGGAFVLFVLLMMSRTYRRLRRERTFESIGQFVATVLFFCSGVFNPLWVSAPACIILLYGRIYVSGNERTAEFSPWPVVPPPGYGPGLPAHRL